MTFVSILRQKPNYKMKSKMLMRYPTTWHGNMWREGAPCGNGIVGALVYGSVDREIILLNHTDLWKGGKIDSLPDISDCLPKLREYLDRNRPDLADGVLSSALKEKGYEPETMTPYPLGDIGILRLSEAPITNYSREVNFENATVRVQWKENSAVFTREVFVSRDNNLCYTRISCSEAGSVSVKVSFDKHDTETLEADSVITADIRTEDTCIFYSQKNQSIYKKGDGYFGGVLKVIPKGGSICEENGTVTVTNADEVLLLCDVFVGQTDAEVAYQSAKKRIDTAEDYDFALQTHTKLHQELYGGVRFTISEDNNTPNELLLLDAFTNQSSNELMETMYAYGRYLFVCSTDTPKRQGALPTHLVGLWNGTYSCFWAFHMFNINFEMIYWQALTGNQPDLARTALDYVESYMEDFRTNAANMFGCRGIYIDSVQTPESGLVSCMANHILNWTSGAAWVSQHFWDYAHYTGDTEYLRNHALPFLKETADFYEDFLEERDGIYRIAPCTSPENVPLNVRRDFHVEAQASVNASMDIALITELLQNLLTGIRETGMYADKEKKWKEMLRKLPPYKTNADGSLKEWADDFYEDNNAHRHQSHLYGVFPGHTVDKNHPFYNAFTKAEQKRIDHGLKSQSSWSMIFMAGVQAHLENAEKAWFALSEMLRYCCMNNLFTVHNDWRRMGSINCNDFRVAPFQIDANIGFPAVVNEMLCQSQEQKIKFFPALPDQWKKGKLEGIRTYGGWIISLTWDGQEANITLKEGFAPINEISFGAGFKSENIPLPILPGSVITLHLVK